jgi:hypothetical protein
MSYYINLKKISLDNLEIILDKADLIKSRMILKERGFYRAQIGLHDMKLTVDAAKFLEQDIKY